MRILPLPHNAAAGTGALRVLLLDADFAASGRRFPYPLPPGDAARLRRWTQRVAFKGAAEEHTYAQVPGGRAPREYLLLGCGMPGKLTASVARKLGGTVTLRLRDLGARRAVIHMRASGGTRWSDDHVWAFASGLYEGRYAVRAESATAGTWRSIHIARHPDPAPGALLLDGASMGVAINLTRPLANKPGNLAPPRMIAEAVRKLAHKLNLRCTVWDERRLKRERCHALLAVGQGSGESPRLIRLEYPGRDPRMKPLVVVGKTITFDTGGISLKAGKNMEWMKFDKSGGMAVLAFMHFVGATLLPRRPVIGILAAAENMPDARAIRPGDIVQSRSGKTIEIVNTDAEGRLVLADALDVAQDLDPFAVIDLATLTGAASVALGRPASALLCNDPALSDSLRAAGEASGDRVWPLPLYDEYEPLLNSPFADIKNIGDGTAGTIVGGIFLRRFIRPGVRWAHIDITSAWEERATRQGPAGATLFGAALLGRWMSGGYADRLGPR